MIGGGPVTMRTLGELYLEAPSRPGRPAHVASASGLARRGDRLYVAPDDEVALAAFHAEDRRPGRLLPLADEPLPLDHDERKAAKPDLEALCWLPTSERFRDGALLALGSGATERRERGWLWALDGPELAGAPVEVSLSQVYDALRDELEDLNIEGAAVTGDRLWLAQRGNGQHGANVLVELRLGEAMHSLEHDSVLPASALGARREYDLGEVAGVPLTFSDLAPAPGGGLVFCAVAEDSESTYEDGPCVGAAVGLLEPEGGRPRLAPLPEPHKVEGVTVTGTGGNALEVLLVADADDPDVPAPLLAASVPLVT